MPANYAEILVVIEQYRPIVQFRIVPSPAKPSVLEKAPICNGIFGSIHVVNRQGGSKVLSRLMWYFPGGSARPVPRYNSFARCRPSLKTTYLLIHSPPRNITLCHLQAQKEANQHNVRQRTPHVPADLTGIRAPPPDSSSSPYRIRTTSRRTDPHHP